MNWPNRESRRDEGLDRGQRHERVRQAGFQHVVTVVRLDSNLTGQIRPRRFRSRIGREAPCVNRTDDETTTRNCLPEIACQLQRVLKSDRIAASGQRQIPGGLAAKTASRPNLFLPVSFGADYGRRIDSKSFPAAISSSARRSCGRRTTVPARQPNLLPLRAHPRPRRRL